MKSNANSTNTGAKTSSSKRPQADKKSTARNMDTTAATEKVKSRTHGHGMSNEGTNVNYEEER